VIFRIRKTNPSPIEPEPFTLAQRLRADDVLRGIDLRIFMGWDDNRIVADMTDRLAHRPAARRVTALPQ